MTSSISVATTHALRRFVGSGILIATCTGCSEDDGVNYFRNDTDDTVWVARREPYSPDGVSVDLRVARSGWTEAPPGDDVEHSQTCVEVGDFIVATQPDDAAIIDIRDIPDGEAVARTGRGRGPATTTDAASNRS